MRLIGLAVMLALSLFAAPFAVSAQQPTKAPLVAVLVPGTSPAGRGLSRLDLQAVREGLRALGYVEGKNIERDVRFEDNKPECWPSIVDELMRRRVDVMVAAAWAASLVVRKGAPGVLVDATMVELLRVQAVLRASSRSDRLRGGLAQVSPPAPLPERSEPTAKTPTPARPPEPARTQERTQPQEPTRPSEATPRQGADEPDPRVVIDWLLKRDRR